MEEADEQGWVRSRDAREGETGNSSCIDSIVHLWVQVVPAAAPPVPRGVDLIRCLEEKRQLTDDDDAGEVKRV